MRTPLRVISLIRWSSRSGISIRTKTSWFIMIRIRLVTFVCSVRIFSVTGHFGWLSSATDAVHVHHEIDIGNILGFYEFTQGYEIWVFDSGTFSLAGDGGYENWAMGGCYSKQDSDVTFMPFQSGGTCWRGVKKMNNYYAVHQENWSFTYQVYRLFLFFFSLLHRTFIVAAHIGQSPARSLGSFFFRWYGISFTREGLGCYFIK